MAKIHYKQSMKTKLEKNLISQRVNIPTTFDDIKESLSNLQVVMFLKNSLYCLEILIQIFMDKLQAVLDLLQNNQEEGGEDR